MESPRKGLTTAEVAACGSAIVTFGLVQGALYLRAYWGHFGIDPFQFVAVSELALTGLTSIGLVLCLALLAALFGDWLQARLTTGSSKGTLMARLACVLIFAALAWLSWWSNAWPILIGVILTLLCALIVNLSPVVPSAVKDSPWLIFALVMLVYMSVISGWLGAMRAKSISAAESTLTTTLTYEGKVQEGVILIGRLGDCYALWDPVRKAAVLLPVSDVQRLDIARRSTMSAPVGR
ncbi:hypothetical protein [Xanthomonas sp. 60]